MTENEIIKFIEHAINSAKSEDGFKEIYWEKLEYILDLINRKKAEIERLKKNIDGLNIFTKNHIKVIRLQSIKEFAERLKETITNAINTYYNSNGGGYYLAEDVIEDIDNLVKEMTEVNKNEMPDIRLQSIKEFAERLKETITNAINTYCNSNGGGYYLAEDVIEDIDNLVKEMTEGEK